MGTPVEPIEYGNDCTWCWSPGKTPKIIKATFRDIECCPGQEGLLPNDKVFLLNQSPGDNCAWYNFDYTDLYVAFWTGDGFAALVVTRFSAPAGNIFSGTDVFSCTKQFTNAFTCLTGITQNGVGHVWWEPDDIPAKLANDFSLCPNPGTLFDRTICGIDHQVIKFANRKDKTNILIEVDNQEF